ncbi:MAG: hypothetical protein JWM68_2116 [Verrucomicrobiales bacterium]|nr:hypothetical protein [Verrucomicrobiales bacterium]
MDTAPLRERPVAIVELTTALASGNEEAFRKFHELYFDRLFRYHIVIARGDDDAACEALQETFLRVARHVRRFDSEETFWSWLTVLCRTAAFDRGRKRQRYWRLIADYARSLLSPVAMPSPDAEEERLNEVLGLCVEELDAAEKALVEGKYFRGASVRELACETGLTEKAVESRLLRARRELRQKILTRMNYEQTP